MRILTPERVLFTGRHLCPELDCPQGPLPDKLHVLLCLLDGAERRRYLQAKLNRPSPGPTQAATKPSQLASAAHHRRLTSR
jgi:hypothetical protein